MVNKVLDFPVAILTYAYESDYNVKENVFSAYSNTLVPLNLIYSTLAVTSGPFATYYTIHYIIYLSPASDKNVIGTTKLPDAFGIIEHYNFVQLFGPNTPVY